MKQKKIMIESSKGKELRPFDKYLDRRKKTGNTSSLK